MPAKRATPCCTLALAHPALLDLLGLLGALLIIYSILRNSEQHYSGLVET
ncbi:hypothetical protein [Pseudomonas guineae]|nr:hypothetical protein [Pseudomonas guineae]